MRASVLPAMALAASLLSACNSSGLSSALDLSEPSPQVTASITPDAPVPGGGIEDGIDDGIDTVESLIDDGPPAAGEAIEAQTDEPVEVALLRPDSAPVTSARNGGFGRIKVYPPRFRDAKPVSFGRVEPDHYQVHGVDVSRWQGRIDWPHLRRQGANFAYIKATEGDDFADPEFRRNWNAAASAGVPRGAYHFFHWCSYGSHQAEWFIRNVPKEKGALPPVIDVEWNHASRTCRYKPSPAIVRQKMKVFMEKVERHYGQKPIIYTSPDFYDDNLKGHFRNHSFWLRSVAAHPKKRYPGQDFAFWQYSGTGLSADHSTQIDLNVFNGTARSWRRWLNAHTR
ncbi:MAG: glycoside hydrolase family 25 protein [Nitratireductor sp.]|nr:glycoside hydrolase family 25 protein [Nitratireductor sp.]